ncbi:MAG: type II secretion system protein N [Gammaproteobacteria bacterium]|nr:type II secretion system protein N [Gammaproteobacteria bacterium]
MKKRHYYLTAIISYFIFLIFTIPAKPVTDLLNDNTPVKIQGVSGSLWNGSAYMVTTDDIQLKKTEWSFSPWKLFTGKIAVDIKTRFLDNHISAEVGTSFIGRFFIEHLSANIAARDIAQLANIPLAQLDGTVSLDIEYAQWKQGELPLASGEIRWVNATITVAETASLGNISIILRESEQQLLNAEIKNQGGDIRITGTAELVPQADYAVDIILAPTATANNNIKRSLGFFAKKQNNGEYTLKKSGPLNQIM